MLKVVFTPNRVRHLFNQCAYSVMIRKLIEENQWLAANLIFFDFQRCSSVELGVKVEMIGYTLGLRDQQLSAPERYVALLSLCAAHCDFEK